MHEDLVTAVNALSEERGADVFFLSGQIERLTSALLISAWEGAMAELDYVLA